MLSLKVDGRKVRRLREGRGLSVVAVAKAAGCTKWAIYKIERGHNQPSPRLHAALKDSLQATDEDLAMEGSQ
ncbi:MULTISPECIES: helix-turn-helix transcriptional regulator [unclassified Streptomyces]|uniref:helix-turn-helix transcriptional regulator n=1 Tax=unclassified Streptomyces TaxID=2593676 RepID=UPI0035E1C7BA